MTDRNRRDFLRISAALCSLPALSNAGTEPRSSERKMHDRPHIILCMADDQGWGDMGHRGHPVLHTPHMDAMAASGVCFDRFYAASPVCSPSRGSVMTGRHPTRFACFNWGHTLRPQEVTLAEALKSNGYVTGHFGKWHIGSVEKDSPVNPGNSGFDTWVSSVNFFDNDPILSHNGVAVQMKGESSMVTVEAAIEFIRHHAGGEKPMFVVVWFGSPHVPHIAVEQDRAHYQDQPPELQHFYGEITGLDRAMGRLRAELRALDIDDNTLLWYCSDNGALPDVGRAGGRGHKGQMYEGGLRVPAMIEWPARIAEPRIVEAPCTTSDIYPTLLSITGTRVAQQPPLDGIDLMPLINGEAQTRPPIGFWHYNARGVRTPSVEWMTDLLEAQQKGNMNSGRPERLFKDAAEITPFDREDFRGHAVWLNWPWKLHRIQTAAGERAQLRLYNLELDPMEQHNRAGQEDERVEKLLANLEEWMTAVVRSLNGEDYR